MTDYQVVTAALWYLGSVGFSGLLGILTPFPVTVPILPSILSTVGVLPDAEPRVTNSEYT